MTDAQRILVVGGTSGIGREIASRYAGEGWAVTLSGRDADRAGEVAAEVGGGATGIAVDLSRPDDLPAVLADVGPLDHLVLAAITRDANTVREYDVAAATYLVTMKLVGYTATVHALRDRLSTAGSIVLFGGLAKERPYPGSTTVSTVNGGVSGMVRTLAVQLAPLRVNALHPGIVGDSPFWAGKDAATTAVRERTPTGRNVAMADIVDAVDFLIRNRSVNGVDLFVDGGWLLQ
ncbi:SDR family oxidoreductase [Nocardioides panacis]|uniref:SDR family oxidoreductase n=1 Tax=Nocardioides panacis TaxID=2849501 RepID=A0A975T1P4_9ACTN|nr:SDR family oxidoreductase [Nocardioides panacis]QWZ09911.1 SDR family oxidoreductase [Nocardioides panacis]